MILLGAVYEIEVDLHHRNPCGRALPPQIKESDYGDIVAGVN